MAKKWKKGSPQWNWEQALIDDYFNNRWQLIMKSLHDMFHRIEKGELSIWELDSAIHAAHKETQEIYKLNTSGRNSLVITIQMDRKWFKPWLEKNPPPPGIELIPAFTFREKE